jgi:tetratricopeptide (TPR) repeat protein
MAEQDQTQTPDPGRLARLARTALEKSREAEVLPLLAQALEARPEDAVLWQWKGILERALEDHSNAVQSFRRAAELAPADASIANGLARTSLEAGLAAADLFERTLQLDPSNGLAYLGWNAARIAEGRADEAESDLVGLLERSPGFLDGHHQLAQLRAQRGQRERAFESIERAVEALPNEVGLRQAHFRLLLAGEEFDQLRATFERARADGFALPDIAAFGFIGASETGDSALADELLSAIPPGGIPATWLARHLLRNGRIEEAAVLVDREVAGPSASQIWTYAETVWRLTNDPRLDWLAGHDQLVSEFDLESELAAIPSLPDVFRAIHERSGQYLDQSVRGGTQTDGHLFSRIEPEIRAVRSAMSRAVGDYLERLQGLPDDHPQKPPPSLPAIRFAGSWSVRLADGGFHASHVHPLGWISSAFYVRVPDAQAGKNSRDGWLVLGEPPAELGLGLEPTRMIEPKPGRLVLFPSWIWHGTRPFSAGERLSIAFDVARPKP